MLIYSLNVNMLLLHPFAPNNAAVHLLLPLHLLLPFNMYGTSIQSYTETFSKCFFCSAALLCIRKILTFTQRQKKGTCHERNHVPKAAQLIRKATHLRINISVTHNRSSNLV